MFSKSLARCIVRAALGPPVISSPPVAKYLFRRSAHTQSNSEPHPQERYFFPCSCAGVSVLENR
jgi:hypothetical protein